MIEFHAHASGSSGNLYTVAGAGGRIAIELGLPFKRIQQALRFDTASLDGALISHDHGDHAQGVKKALERGVDCYMSLGTAQALGVQQHHRVHIMKANHGYNVGPFRVFAWGAVHDCAEPLGFVITDADRDRLLYATDTAYIPHAFTGLTHIAIEANYSREALDDGVAQGFFSAVHARRVLQFHMSIERALDFLAASREHDPALREITLLHLSAGNSDADGFADQVRRLTGLPTYVASERAAA